MKRILITAALAVVPALALALPASAAVTRTGPQTDGTCHARGFDGACGVDAVLHRPGSIWADVNDSRNIPVSIVTRTRCWNAAGTRARTTHGGEVAQFGQAIYKFPRHRFFEDASKCSTSVFVTESGTGSLTVSLHDYKRAG